MKDKQNNIEEPMFFAAAKIPQVPTVFDYTYYDFVPFAEKGKPFNDFFIQLIDMVDRSALHNAIITSKLNQVCGGGIEYVDETQKNIRTEEFIKKANRFDTLEELINKITYDYILFGGFYIQKIKRRDGLYEFVHLPFHKVLSGKKDETGVVGTYYYSDNWEYYRRADYMPKEYMAYKDGSNQPSEIIPVKQYRPNWTTEYYPAPDYIGALTAIQTDAEISNFALSNIQNGMVLSKSITFVEGKPNADERRKILQAIDNQYLGTDGKKIMVNFVNGKDNAPIVEAPANNDNSKLFIELKKEVEQSILSGHRVTSPLLVGISTAGQLGSNTEMMNAQKLFNNLVIAPYRTVIQNTLDMMTTLNKLPKLEVKGTTPVEFMWSENIMEKIMTVDEMREMVGMEPMKKDNNIITE